MLVINCADDVKVSKVLTISRLDVEQLTLKSNGISVTESDTVDDGLVSLNNEQST